MVKKRRRLLASQHKILSVPQLLQMKLAFSVVIQQVARWSCVEVGAIVIA